MEQYRLLAECLLPAHMLDWFKLKDVRVEVKGDTQVVHIYLEENDVKPDYQEDLRPNGFTRESVFHDFPIRGHEVLLHVRRRRWLDTNNCNVMTECKLIQGDTQKNKVLKACIHGTQRWESLATKPSMILLLCTTERKRSSTTLLTALPMLRQNLSMPRSSNSDPSYVV